MYKPIQETLKTLRDEFRRAAQAFPPLYHDQVLGSKAKEAFELWKSHRRTAGQTWQWWHGPCGPKHLEPVLAEFESIIAEARRVFKEKGIILTAEQEAAALAKYWAVTLQNAKAVAGDAATLEMLTLSMIEAAQVEGVEVPEYGWQKHTDTNEWYGRFYGDRSGMEEFKRLAESTFLALNELEGELHVSSSGWTGFLEFMYELAEDYPTPLLRTRWEIYAWRKTGWYTGVEYADEDSWYIPATATAEPNAPSDLLDLKAAFRTMRVNIFSAAIATITMILEPDKTVLVAWDKDEGTHSLDLVTTLTPPPDAQEKGEASAPRNETADAKTSDKTEAQSLATPLAPGRNIFKRNGDIWIIEFVSGAKPERTTLRPTEGLKYYTFLLRNPNKIFKYPELDGISVESLQEIEHSFQAEVETEDRPHVRTDIERLKTERREAEKDGATARVNELDKQIQSAQVYLDKSENYHDNPRRLGSAPPMEKVRKRIQKAMDRCLERLQQHAPLLHNYLESHVRIRNVIFVSYTPTTPIDWDCGEYSPP